VKKTLVAILIIALSAPLYSQELKGGNGIYTRDKANRVKGWYVGPGISYMFPYLKEQDKLEIADTVLSYTAKPGGKIGLYLEAGYFRFFTKRRLIFDFWDAGLSYKWLRGKETFNQTLSVAEQNIYDVETQGKYSDHFISGNLNFSHKYDFYNESGFWVNTFGLNADYPIISSQSPTPALPNASQQVPGFTFQLHYKMGYGIKWNDRLWIVPSLETPILNIVPFQNGSSTLSYFNTRARPLLLSVRFMFISQKGKNDCPPVRNPAGYKPDGY